MDWNTTVDWNTYSSRRNVSLQKFLEGAGSLEEALALFERKKIVNPPSVDEIVSAISVTLVEDTNVQVENLTDSSVTDTVASTKKAKI